MARNDLIILQRGSQGLRSLLRTPGLVAAYLPYLDGSGQTLTDWTGLGNDRQLGSTAGADADDPTWGTGGKWLEFDGIDDVLADGPAATTVWSLLGDNYGNALGWVRGKRKNVAGRMYAELRFNREIGAFERARIFANVRTLLTAQDITGKFYDWAYPIPCTAGTMDFSIANATDLLWVAPDGATSTAARPQFTHASQQTSWAFCSNWDAGNLEINDNATDALHIGDLADLPPVLAYSLNLDFCSNVTGDLENINNLEYLLNMGKTYNITGDLSDVGKLTNYLRLSDNSHITGILEDVSKLTYTLYLVNCVNITGTLSPKATLQRIYLNGTGLNTTQLDNSIIALANVTTVVGILDYSLGVRSTASDAAYDALAAMGWTLPAREW